MYFDCFFVAKKNIGNLNIFEILNNLYFWFDAGILGQKPSLFNLPDSHLINAAVTWTLFWEWAFYFSLPLVHLVRDQIGTTKLALAVLFICAYIIYPHYKYWSVFIAFFAVGGLARDLHNKLQIPKKICDYGIVLSIIFMFFIADDSYNIFYLPVLSLLFILITLGGDIFGLLRLKAFVRLGSASYSIYLLHGIAWYGMNKIIQIQQLTLNSTNYTLLSTVVMLILLVICTITFHYIEKPFMVFGRHKSKWFKKA